jgi:hypothetical protein
VFKTTHLRHNIILLFFLIKNNYNNDTFRGSNDNSKVKENNTNLNAKLVAMI